MEVTQQDMLMTIGKQTLTIAILENKIVQLETQIAQIQESKQEDKED